MKPKYLQSTLCSLFAFAFFFTSNSKAEISIGVSGRVAQKSNEVTTNMAGYQATTALSVLRWVEIIGTYYEDRYSMEYLDRTDQCSETFMGGGIGLRHVHFFIDALAGQVNKNFAVKKEHEYRVASDLGFRYPLLRSQSISLSFMASMSKDLTSQEIVKAGVLGIQTAFR